MRRAGGITKDIYGFYPKESCFHQPNVARLGLTLASKIGPLDMKCNGISLPGYHPIDKWGAIFDWPSIKSTFHASNLQCTISNANKQVLSASFDIKKILYFARNIISKNK